jgi:NAD(P)-dependent dehydrogenase (short-subunit alcohol dehydrogenase family)
LFGGPGVAWTGAGRWSGTGLRLPSGRCRCTQDRHHPSHDGLTKGTVADADPAVRALAWAADRIRVNAVAPGWIETAMSAHLDSDVRAAVIARLLNARFGEPEGVAGAVLFLASPAARLVTEVTIPVDDGYTAS